MTYTLPIGAEVVPIKREPVLDKRGREVGVFLCSHGRVKLTAPIFLDAKVHVMCSVETDRTLHHAEHRFDTPIQDYVGVYYCPNDVILL